MPTDAITPFRIDVPQLELDDLRDRLRRTRWPADRPDTGWTRGVAATELRELAAYWGETFDWRAQEARLNAVAQFTTTIDDQPIHFLHARSSQAGATPLLLTHGWPGSIAEFAEVIGPLTEPAAHGAAGAIAFDVVIPAIPGYGYSSPLTDTGWDVVRIARAWLQLMDRLGYERFGVQGGDWGSPISRQVGVLAPDRVIGVHLNSSLDGVPRDPSARDGLSDLELAHLAARDRFWAEGRGYMLLQSTRPDTVGYALTDSPVGQLAWILEKFHEWTDPAGGPFDGIDRDHLLTDVSLYWFTRTAASSAQLYWELRHGERSSDVSTVPTAVAVFAHDIAPAVRRFVERRNTIVRWTEFERGGHFAALEQPAALTQDIRAFFGDAV